MKIVLLLCLVGLALSHPISYEYRYSANVATGAIELSNQLSGVELVADVRVTISGDKKRATIQIVNPKVGSFNGIVKSGRTPLPAPLEPMPDAKQIEKPFVVTFSSSSERLHVPADDALWMVNLRKGIASTLRVPYVFSTPGRSIADLSQNRISSSVQLPTSYQKIEETMHGQCLVRYTISRTQSSRMTTETYRVVKSVDFDSCNEEIVLTKSSQGNLTAAGNGQTRGIQSRSSVGTYFLSGSLDSRFAATVEEAVIEGIVTLNPMGHNTKKMVSITNQTLILSKSNIRDTATEPRIEDLRPENWNFRMESPHKKSATSPAWISFLNMKDVTYPIYPDMLGFPLTSQLRKQIKANIKTLVEYIIVEMPKVNEIVNVSQGTKDGQMVRNITRIVKKMRLLPFADLEELFNEIAAQPGFETDNIKYLKRNLMIETYRSAGSSSAFKVLIKHLRNNKLSKVQAIKIFMSMNVGAYDPIMVAELMEYVKTLPESTNITVKAAALINLSTLVRRICVLESPRDFVFPQPVFGENQCVHQVADFVNYLKSQLEKSSKSSSRAIYIQSLANLGVMEGLKVLAQVAKGIKYTADKNMQLLAINGLTKNHLKNSSYEFTREVLVSIVENQQYRPEVREVALVSLFTIPQNASMWQRIALNTWRDTSKRVPVFIHSYIKAVAESRNPHFIHKINIARQVLPLTKQFKWISLASKYWSVSDYSISQDLGYQMELVNGVRDSNSTPTVIKAKFLAIAGGLKFPIFHYSSIGETIKPELLRSVKQMIGGMMGQHFTKSPEYRQAVSHLEVMSDSEQLYHLTLFKDIEMFIPITGDYLKELLHPEQSSMAQLFRKFKRSVSTNHLASTNIADEFEFIPSDIGVPIIAEMFRPVFAYQQVNCKTISDAQSNMTIIEGKSVTKLILGNDVSLSMLVPWTNQTISVEVHGETSFIIPTEFSAELILTKSEVKIVNYSLRVLNEHEKPVPVAVTYVQPFTAVRPTFDVKPTREGTSYKPIVIGDEYCVGKSLFPLPELVNITVQVCGDIDNLLQAERLMDVTPIDALSALLGPTIEHYQIVVLYTPSRQYPSMKLAGRFMFADVPKSLSAQQVFKVEAAPLIEDMSVQDTVDQRMQKISKSPVSKMLSASMSLEGSTVPIKFEFVTLLAPQHIVKEKPLSFKKLYIQTNFLKSTAHVPSSQVCVHSSLKVPVVEPSRPVSQFMSHSMPFEIMSRFFSGEYCRTANQDLIMKAKFEMTQERQERLFKLRSADSQNFKAVEPVFDRMTVDVEKMKSLDPMVEKAIHTAHTVFFPTVWQTSPIQEGSSKIVKLIGQRSLSTNLLTLRMQSPHGVGVRTDMRVPFFVDAFAPVAAI